MMLILFTWAMFGMATGLAIGLSKGAEWAEKKWWDGFRMGSTSANGLPPRDAKGRFINPTKASMTEQLKQEVKDRECLKHVEFYPKGGLHD